MVSDPSIVVERLDKSHDKEEFDCGDTGLNEYLHRFARPNTERGIGTTYVAVRRGRKRVLAYYTISSGQVAREDMPDRDRKSLPRYPIPVVRIGRLASDVTVRGQGLGTLMLIDALRRARELADVLGIYAVEVDALNDDALRFYEKFGFKSLLDDKQHLYISMKTVRRLFQ